MAERAVKKTGGAGPRNGSGRKTPAAAKTPARAPRITQADFDELFARMDARIANIEAINARVGRKLGL